MQSSRKQRGKANFIHRSRRHLCAAHKTWMPAQMGAIGATTSHHKPEFSLQQVQKKKRNRKEKKHKNTHERGEKQKTKNKKKKKPDRKTWHNHQQHRNQNQQLLLASIQLELATNTISQGGWVVGRRGGVG